MFESYINNTKKKWDLLARQVTEVYLVQKHSLERNNFQKRGLKRDG